MKFDKFKDVAELIGIVAIGASLIFVGLQMRQDQEIAIVDALSLRVVTTANETDLKNRDSLVVGSGRGMRARSRG